MWRQLSAGLGATVVAVAIWIGADPFAPPLPTFLDVGSPAAVSLPTARLFSDLGDVMALEPVIFAPSGVGPGLDHEAGAAVSGAALIAGRNIQSTDEAGGRWEIDLTGSPVMADRIAIGLIQLSVPFERSITVDDEGHVGSVLSGPGSLDRFVSATPVLPAQAVAMLATIVELSGSPGGQLGPREHAATIDDLARTLGLDPTLVDGTPTISSIDDLTAVAGYPVTDPTRVPGLGGQSRPATSGEQIPLVDEFWIPATTGPLIPGAPHSIAPEDGGIGWTNREAQRYDPAAVTFATDRTGSEIVLDTEGAGTPNIDELPFRSGMVIAEQQFGWGTLEVDITLPSGDGLWPAVWLLDAQACDAPGRCPNYATNAYHEIDLIETRGDRPDEAFTSLHWFDERIRSTSGTALIGPDPSGLDPASAGPRVHVTVERRPGIIVWRLDGDVVYVVGGEVVGTPSAGEEPAGIDAGPHRSKPMHLIINSAVGGNFAGGRIIGRTGQWWGDAQVPDAFPNLGWDSATLTVHEVRVTPLGS